MSTAKHLGLILAMLVTVWLALWTPWLLTHLAH